MENGSVFVGAYPWNDVDGVLVGQVLGLTRRNGEEALVLRLFGDVQFQQMHSGGPFEMQGYGIVELDTGLLLQVDLAGRGQIWDYGTDAELTVRATLSIEPAL